MDIGWSRSIGYAIKRRHTVKGSQRQMAADSEVVGRCGGGRLRCGGRARQWEECRRMVRCSGTYSSFQSIHFISSRYWLPLTLPQPISLLSLRTEEETPAEPMQADPQGTPASYRLSLGGLGGFGRNQRQRNLPEEASSTAPPPPVLGEIDRPLNQDEPLSVGVIIRMPLDPEWYKELQRTDSGLDDGDEEPGWRPGMELGVWSGVTT